MVYDIDRYISESDIMLYIGIMIPLKYILYSYYEFFCIKWLGNIVITSELKHLDLIIYHIIRGEGDDSEMRISIPNLSHKIPTIQYRHIDIE